MISADIKQNDDQITSATTMKELKKLQPYYTISAKLYPIMSDNDSLVQSIIAKPQLLFVALYFKYTTLSLALYIYTTI